MRRTVVFIAGLAIVSVVTVQADDLQTIRSRGIGASRQELLAYVKSYSADGVNPKTKQEIQRLIGELGADTFRVRERAHQALSKFGDVVVPFLKELDNSPDAEVRVRAREILRLHEKKYHPDALEAALRMLSQKPDREVLATILNLPPETRNPIQSTILEAGKKNVRKDDFKFLSSLLDEAGEPNQSLLLYCIGVCGDQKAAGVMEKYLNSKSDSNRFESAFYFANRGDRRCLGALHSLLLSKDKVLRSRASYALMQLCQKSFDTSNGKQSEFNLWKGWLSANADKVALRFPIKRIGFLFVGSTWRVVHTGVALKPTLWEFRKSGVIFSPKHPRNINRWVLKGDKMVVHYNNKYVEYTGRLVSPSKIVGNALNKRSKRWTWVATKIKDAP